MIQEDIVYGKITINGIYEKVSNTKEFQRLKDITQTSDCTLKYKKLEKETRYEHSIGTYHLMEYALTSIKGKLEAKGLNISSREENLAKMAMLLHDIGHGADSHGLEEITGVAHEQRTIEVIKSRDTQVHQVIAQEYGEDFVNELVEFMEYIYGDGKQNPPDKLSVDNGQISMKQLLSLLISNSIDLDRLDYLNREGKYIGRTGLANPYEVIDKFKFVFTGRNLEIAFAEEDIELVDRLIFARTGNYRDIYYIKEDAIGIYITRFLREQLRAHPEEMLEDIPIGIRKYLFCEKDISTKEYLEITETPLKQVVKQIESYTKNELIKYLCQDKHETVKDFKVLSEEYDKSYARNVLHIAIPELPIDTGSVVERNKMIQSYKGGIKILKEDGTLVDYKDIGHATNLEPIQKKVLAINPEIIRLELGLSKKEFDEKYGDTIKEVISSLTKPQEEFELRYVLDSSFLDLKSVAQKLKGKFEIVDQAQYVSYDNYYDTKDFSFLQDNKILRERQGYTNYKGKPAYTFKRKKITFKQYSPDSDDSDYTCRRKEERIGNSSYIEDYEDFIRHKGYSVEELLNTLSVKNSRRLITVKTTKGALVDISFNIGHYQDELLEDEKGELSTIEIRPRDNNVNGRIDLKEIQHIIEREIPGLQGMISKDNIYAIGMSRICKQYERRPLEPGVKSMKAKLRGYTNLFEKLKKVVSKFKLVIQPEKDFG